MRFPSRVWDLNSEINISILHFYLFHLKLCVGFLSGLSGSNFSKYYLIVSYPQDLRGFSSIFFCVFLCMCICIKHSPNPLCLQRTLPSGPVCYWLLIVPVSHLLHNFVKSCSLTRQSLLRKELRRIKLQGTKQVECIPSTSHWKNLLVSLCEIPPMYFSVIIMANIYWEIVGLSALHNHLHPHYVLMQ